MIAYVFPGQGAQYKGMGKDLFDEFPDIVEKADNILGYSIRELCLEDPCSKLGLTEYTQPAIYIVNVLSYLKKIHDAGIRPDYVAGHSLGEYNALFAAGAFDFETGLKLVKKRGELMGHASGGGMAAVIGLDEKQLKDLLAANNLNSIDIANYNSPTQIVISGPKESIVQAKEVFEHDPDVKYFTILNVSGAFHSRYMEEAGNQFKQFLEEFVFDNINIPVISNVYARPYTNADIKDILVKQISNSVRWTDSIRFLLGKGEVQFEEIGIGRTLTGLIRHIAAETEPLIIEEKFTKYSLGSEEFKNKYNLKYPYIAGAMYRGVASKELVISMGRAGMMGFLGTGGISLDDIETDIQCIQKELPNGQPYGLNFLYNPNNPAKEEDTINLYLKYGIKVIEASAFMGITSSLVRYKAKGLRKNPDGKIITDNRIIAKLSRPEVAEAFMSPAPIRIIVKLLEESKITESEAEMLKCIPVADDVCVEADSGGHTDCGVAYTLMPAIIKLRNDLSEKYGYIRKICIGAAGGIGTPEAAAAAFILGADFIVTGSINQCTVEAGTSSQVKDLLQKMNVQDTDYAPAGDMFEFGARVQVLKKGLFFPARANKLFDLYKQYDSIDEIDNKTKTQLQEKYFKRSFDRIYEEVKSFYSKSEIEKAESNSKYKMALIFKWYFHYSTECALSGSSESVVDYQVHCGPSLGAFNQWIKGTEYEPWSNRHVAEIGLMILDNAASYLNNRFHELTLNK